MNYTKEQRDYMVRVYQENPCRETVELLAKELGKSTKSIIGKLSREKVYRREIYKTKLGETPIRKIEIVAQIAEELDIDSDKLCGLDKSPKHVLKLLKESISNK
jgi:hypothetical protein